MKKTIGEQFEKFSRENPVLSALSCAFVVAILISVFYDIPKESNLIIALIVFYGQLQLNTLPDKYETI